MSKSSIIPSFENCLGLSINSSTFPEASDESGNESDSFKGGETNKKNGGAHHKGSKRKEKMNYKQVNMLQNIDKMINKEYFEVKANNMLDILLDNTNIVDGNYYYICLTFILQDKQKEMPKL